MKRKKSRKDYIDFETPLTPLNEPRPLRLPERTCTNADHLRLITATDHPVCPQCFRILYRRPSWKCIHGALRIGCTICKEDLEKDKANENEN